MAFGNGVGKGNQYNKGHIIVFGSPKALVYSSSVIPQKKRSIGSKDIHKLSP